MSWFFYPRAEFDADTACISRSPRDSRSSRLPRLLQWWIAAEERARTRRALGQLDARLLDDVGIPPAAAERECRKAYWE